MGDATDRALRRVSRLVDTVLCEVTRALRDEDSGERFVPVEARSWATDLSLPAQVEGAIQAAKWNEGQSGVPPLHWKGVLNMKDPFSLAAYPMLLWELRPRTVIEIGAYHGGSACWIGDLLDAMAIDAQVLSFDLDVERIVAKHPRVTFARADSNDVASFDRDKLHDLPHPWLVIEDAHVNLRQVLAFFDAMMRDGDYFVVEDTVDHEKYLALRSFLVEAGGRYLVDTRFTDLFGYNVTWHPNGYVKRVR